eukprot:5332526-Prymnesium_polylepis.1
MPAGATEAVADACGGAAGSSSMRPPRRSTTAGGGGAGGAACVPSVPATIMSDVMLASDSRSSSTSTRPAPRVGTVRVRPETKVEGGLW